MNGAEIELKLALAPDGLDRLRRHPLLRHHCQGRPATKILTSTYYDTPDFALARAGVTVRVRVSGRHNIQTVKTANNRCAGLFARHEWESPVASRAIDLPQLRATGVPILVEGDAADRLVPVFRTTMHRTARILAGDGWRIELALDRGEVSDGHHSEPICEAELELKEGRSGHLFDLARQIAAIVPVRLASASKSDRGYALAAGTRPQPAKACPVAVAADMSVAEGFQSVARNCLGHLLANENALLDTGSGEAIHQMRVALRRLRSAIKVFRPIVAGGQLAQVSDEIRWLLAELGPARDSDVLITEIIDPVVDRYPDTPALADLRTRWMDRRDDCLDTARKAVTDRRFTHLLLALGAWVEAGDWLSGDPAHLSRPLGPFAASVLAKRYRRLRKAGGRRLDGLPPPELHRVRILGKQLRYAGEFFAPLYSRKASRAFLETLADLQDALGELNDIAVAGPTLAAGHLNGDQAWAAGVVSGWHEARRPALMERAETAWKRVRKSQPFWN